MQTVARIAKIKFSFFSLDGQDGTAVDKEVVFIDAGRALCHPLPFQ